MWTLFWGVSLRRSLNGHLPSASFIRPAAWPFSLANLALRGAKEQTPLFAVLSQIGECTDDYQVIVWEEPPMLTGSTWRPAAQRSIKMTDIKPR